jgi:hypothetical protein
MSNYVINSEMLRSVWLGEETSFTYNDVELQIEHGKQRGTLSISRSQHIITAIRYNIDDDTFTQILDFCASELCDPESVHVFGEFRIHIGGKYKNTIYMHAHEIHIIGPTKPRTFRNYIGLMPATPYIVKLKLVLERLLTEYGIDFPESKLHGMMATNMVKNAAAVH